MRREIVGVEKMVLYYAAYSPEFQSPRQITDVLKSRLSKIPSGQRFFKYDNLFDPDDPEREIFRQEHPESKPLQGEITHIQEE
jgi:hypothetical protein